MSMKRTKSKSKSKVKLNWKKIKIKKCKKRIKTMKSNSTMKTKMNKVNNKMKMMMKSKTKMSKKKDLKDKRLSHKFWKIFLLKYSLEISPLMLMKKPFTVSSEDMENSNSLKSSWINKQAFQKEVLSSNFKTLLKPKNSFNTAEVIKWTC